MVNKFVLYVDASHITGLTYFSRSQGSTCKIETMVNQSDTNHSHCTQRLVILHSQAY